MKKGARLLSPFGLAQIVTVLVIGAGLWLAFGPWRWGRLKEEVRGRFPSVPRIAPEDLARWRELPVMHPVLFDARGETEYNTSHIPGARRAPASPAQLGIDASADVPIIVYCAVGFDSAPVAFRYIAQGYKRVQYLEGRHLSLGKRRPAARKSARPRGKSESRQFTAHQLSRAKTPVALTWNSSRPPR
jgi:rhodanese-related sulfurtransferase